MWTSSMPGCLPGATDGQGAVSPLSRRREPGAGRREPLSGAEHHRALPGDRLRRAADLARGRGAGGGGGGGARRRAGMRPTMRRWRRRSGGSGRRTGWRSFMTATRSGSEYPVLFFEGMLPDLERRDGGRGELRAGGGGGGAGGVPGGHGDELRGERAVQGGVDHPGTTGARRRGCTRCRWSWRSRATSPPRRRRGRSTRRRRGGCGGYLGGISSATLAELAAELAGLKSCGSAGGSAGILLKRLEKNGAGILAGISVAGIRLARFLTSR